MRKWVVFIAATALVIGSSAACSSGHPAKPNPGVLPAGTAQLTIDGRELPPTTAVECAPAEQYLTTIKTGDDVSGATVTVSNANKLTVEFVRIRNLGGFSGDYDRHLAGTATVALTENTYHITGAAFGYGPKSPEPTTEPFTLAVSC
jgi:lipoprotein LpqH